jgi:putative transcriptional regulator
MIFLAPGTLLIAAPGMLDPNFMHTVAMVGHHDGEGAQGLVINRPKPGGMSLAGLEVQEGGPVGLGQHQLLHASEEFAHCSNLVVDGIWMAQEPGPVLEALESGRLSSDSMRLFEGYSGWGAGQLEVELREKAWLVCEPAPQLVFGDLGASATWREALRLMGPAAEGLAHLPPDISWN